MSSGADQNLGPNDDGRRRSAGTPSTDDSAKMAENRETPAVAPSISGLIADCVKTISSFPWANGQEERAKGQEKRVEAWVKDALNSCLEYRLNRMLEL